MKTSVYFLFVVFLGGFLFSCQPDKGTRQQSPEKGPKQYKEETSRNTKAGKTYQDLLGLFKKWRKFENPPLRNGAPDYTVATFEKRKPTFEKLRAELLAIDTTQWKTAHKVDWYIVWAEMNGYDFNQRVLKPWIRDPAFYKSVWQERSDVPAHEGPTHHRTTEVWTYQFPLSTAEKKRLLDDLKVIPPLNQQAQTNLTGNARDLWVTGIRDIRRQSESLKQLMAKPKVKDDKALVATIEEAIQSTNKLVVWLEKEAKSKTGPSA